MQELINDYFKRINKSYFNKDNWIYVYIQSLFEKISIKLLRLDESEIQHYNIIKLFKEYDKSLYNINPIKDIVLICNQYANKIKHYSEDEISFDADFVDDIILKIDNFIYEVYGIHYLLNVFKQKSVIENSLKDFEVYIPFFGDYASNGFIIKFKNSIYNEESFVDNALLSIVYGIITRSSKFNKNKHIREYENNNNIYVDLLKVANNEILILFLLKYGIISKNLNKIQLEEDNKHEFILAFNEIKRYMINILRLMKNDYQFIDFNLELVNDVKYSLSHTLEVKMIDSNEGIKPFNWNHGKVRYNIVNSDKDILLDFLNEFFNYLDFKPGQFESIMSMLNLNENSMTILPTGQGKSLIYFFISLLLPGTSIIISPTNILIEDQIRNLDDFNIDNVLGVLDSKYLEEYLNNYKIIYLTSINFLDNKIYTFLNNYNKNNKFSQIVIDEVHTICQWSHDFRPEYLMLTKFLNVDFTGNICRCFTATATYKVIKDISKNLNIDISKIVTLNRKINDCFNFDFCSIDETNLVDVLSSRLTKLINDNSKSMIFLYDKFIKEFIKTLPIELQITSNYISEYGTFHYDEFVRGNKKLLFANGELGIGINLPEIKNILHCYIPKSLPQYIQEIGRSSRDDLEANSIVIFQKINDEDIDIFNAVNSHKHLNMAILNNSNIVKQLIKQITNGTDMKTAVNRTVDLWWKLYDGETKLDKKTNPFYLYVLSIFDFIKKWHYAEDCIIVYPNISRNIAKANFRLREFFKENNCFEEYEYELNEAGTASRLISIYYNWWFKNYIRFHIIQYIEAYKFFVNETSNEEKISKINNLLSVSLLKIDEIVVKDELSFNKISNYSFKKIKEMEPIIQEAYLYEKNLNYDYFYFIRDLYYNKINDLHLRNILTNEKEFYILEFKKNIKLVYSKLESNTKLLLIKALLKYKKLDEVLSYFYTNSDEPDSVYYYFYIKLINQGHVNFE